MKHIENSIFFFDFNMFHVYVPSVQNHGKIEYLFGFRRWTWIACPLRDIVLLKRTSDLPATAYMLHHCNFAIHSATLRFAFRLQISYYLIRYSKHGSVHCALSDCHSQWPLSSDHISDCYLSNLWVITCNTHCLCAFKHCGISDEKTRVASEISVNGELPALEWELRHTSWKIATKDCHYATHSTWPWCIYILTCVINLHLHLNVSWLHTWFFVTGIFLVSEIIWMTKIMTVYALNLVKISHKFIIISKLI